jgi:hypothetical protein
MREKLSCAAITLLLVGLTPNLLVSPAAEENRYLIVNGQLSQVTILQINGRSYADLEALARTVHGSLAFSGNQIALTLPSSATSPSSTASLVSSSPVPGLSRDFLRAGIEAMSNVREWHSVLVNAIRNQYPISENLLAASRDQASTNLRLASVAASTDADRSAFLLLNNEFINMKQLNDKYIAKSQSASYIAPDSLQNDDLDKKIVTCGHAIAAMVASGQFQDDDSCH